MMALPRDVIFKRQVLMQEWNKRNLAKCGELLNELKLALTQLTFLPTSNATATNEELIVARDILEVGAQWSVATKDTSSFERYMAQLKSYYLDYEDALPKSAYKEELLGLNLLCLLSLNRVADFHTELELLPPEVIQNIYINYPITVEQNLMEGSYNKVFLSKDNVPAKSYNYFIDILLDTVRGEIADCIEKAYEKISLQEAKRMLVFKTIEQVTDYARQKKWTSMQGHFYFNTKAVENVDDSIPASELASQTITYARELEMIV